jgi:hypothetical protein
MFRTLSILSLVVLTACGVDQTLAPKPVCTKFNSNRTSVRNTTDTTQILALVYTCK